MAAYPQSSPTTPHAQPLPGITHAWFSLIHVRSPLLAESLLFSLPMGTEMFHFPTSPPHRLCIHLQVTPHNWCWVSPFGHPRINALLATPRGLTQPHTSFIGPACQGIHHTPVTQNNNYGRYKNCRQLNKQKLHKKNKMLASTIQFSHNTHPTKTNHHNR